MDYIEYFKKFDQDKEYIEAEKELKPIFDIADEVLRLRLKRGWSQSELANRAGTKQANISRIESGLSNPSIKALQKLAAALETQVVIHFEGTKESTTESTAIFAPHWPTKTKLSSRENPASYQVTKASF